MKKIYWHEIFEASIFLKVINSIWEITSGLILVFVSSVNLEKFLSFISHKELLEDPRDVFILFVSDKLHHLSTSTKDFVAFYVLFHGFLNMFLAYNLFKKRHWSYLVAIGFTSIFSVYQIYRINHTGSLFLLGVTIFDIFFIYLTQREYRRLMDIQNKQNPL